MKSWEEQIYRQSVFLLIQQCSHHFHSLHSFLICIAWNYLFWERKLNFADASTLLLSTIFPFYLTLVWEINIFFSTFSRDNQTLRLVSKYPKELQLNSHCLIHMAVILSQSAGSWSSVRVQKRTGLAWTDSTFLDLNKISRKSRCQPYYFLVSPAIEACQERKRQANKSLYCFLIQEEEHKKKIHATCVILFNARLKEKKEELMYHGITQDKVSRKQCRGTCDELYFVSWLDFSNL